MFLHKTEPPVYKNDKTRLPDCGGRKFLSAMGMSDSVRREVSGSSYGIRQCGCSFELHVHLIAAPRPQMEQPADVRRFPFPRDSGVLADESRSTDIVRNTGRA